MILCNMIAAALLTAAPGDTIRATGTCDAPLRIPARDYAGVTLDATSARIPGGAVGSGPVRLHIKGGTWGLESGVMAVFHTIQISNAEDFRFTDATVFTNGRAGGAGILVAVGARVTIARNRFAGRNTGLTVRTVTDTTVERNIITGSAADGINVTDSQRVTVAFNQCRDFNPGPGAHPDCLQLRNLPDKPPQSDVLVLGNVAIGRMQAFFGHCNRTTYIANYAATLGYTHTITCSSGASNTAIGNVLTNMPGAPHGPGSLKGFTPEWAARNTLWDARVLGVAPMPMGLGTLIEGFPDPVAAKVLP